MTIKTNSFYLLGISPYSTRQDISDARTEAIFDNIASEDVLEKAENNLTSSMPRLKEEVSYLWGLDSLPSNDLVSQACTSMNGQSFCEMVNKMKLDGITTANIASEFCSRDCIGKASGVSHALNLLISSQKRISIKEAWDMINNARKKSKLAPPISQEHVESALKKINHDAYMKAAMNVIISSEMPYQMATAMAEKWRFDKTRAGDFVADVIRNPYQSWVYPDLLPLEEKIDQAIDVLYDNPQDTEALLTIEAELSEWDKYNQPIQLIDEGKGLNAEKSMKFFKKLRALYLHMHNEKEATENSLRITKILVKVFPELPGAYEIMSKDMNDLEKLLAQKKHVRGVKKQIKKIDDIIKKINDNPAGLPRNWEREILGEFKKLLQYDGMSDNREIWMYMMYIRGTAIVAHNELGMSDKSAWLTDHLLALAKEHDAPYEIQSKLEEDKKALLKMGHGSLFDKIIHFVIQIIIRSTVLVIIVGILWTLLN